ncbi:hypothetical protein NQZ79_g6276 [Umbelopsis isabellina]|nr:hypothetical protein NQZ79_g6276 [Umbelopsis isabellina]
MSNMDYSSNSKNWWSSPPSSNHILKSSDDTEENIPEPVPFEDFKFSLGLDPDFSIPIPLETPPPLPVADMPTEFPSADPFTQQNTNPLLDENDQRAFSQFLDSFFVEQDSSVGNDQLNLPSSLFDQRHSSDSHDQRTTSHYGSWNQAPSSYYHEPSSGVLLNQDHHDYPPHEYHDQDQHRRSIIDSLDASHQQRFYQQISSMNVPFKTETDTEHVDLSKDEPQDSQRNRRRQSVKRRASDTDSDEDEEMAESPGSSTSGTNYNGANKRSKPHKELLTEEEKRANHIASEQKRRNTIRTGFKELTDIIPTLKNINNSKSTILFKAVEYIRYLERRNRGLRERVGGLEVRVEVEGRMGNLMSHSHLGNSGRRNTMSNFMNIRNENTLGSMERNRTSSHSGSFSTFTKSNNPATTTNNNNTGEEIMSSRFVENTSGLPPAAAAALLAHKTQQKQLQAFQEQLQLHQRLLAQQKGGSKKEEKSFLDERRQSTPTFTATSPTRSTNYDSISIPISDANNNSYGNEKSSSMALVVPNHESWRENNDRYQKSNAINIPVDNHDDNDQRPTKEEEERSARSELRSPEKPTSDLMTSLKHGIATTTAVAASSS